MSRLLYINRCICRWFCHSRCGYRLLRKIWFNKCLIVHHGWMSRRIPRLCQTHEGMRYHVEPLHVVCYTLSKCNTYLTHRCKVFRKLDLSIINIFYTSRLSNKGVEEWSAYTQTIAQPSLVGVCSIETKAAYGRRMKTFRSFLGFISIMYAI